MNPLARIAYNMIAEGGEAAGKSAADDVLKAASKIADEGIAAITNATAPQTSTQKVIGKRNKRLSELWDEEVYELDPERFTGTYKVGWPYEDASTWDELSELEDYWEGPLLRTNPDDIDASDIIAMTDDIEKRGIQTPVRISRETGQVLDGHHRVMAARDTGRKIPFVLV